MWLKINSLLRVTQLHSTRMSFSSIPQLELGATPLGGCCWICHRFFWYAGTWPTIFSRKVYNRERPAKGGYIRIWRGGKKYDRRVLLWQYNFRRRVKDRARNSLSLLTCKSWGGASSRSTVSCCEYDEPLQNGADGGWTWRVILQQDYFY